MKDGNAILLIAVATDENGDPAIFTHLNTSKPLHPLLEGAINKFMAALTAALDEYPEIPFYPMGLHSPKPVPAPTPAQAPAPPSTPQPGKARSAKAAAAPETPRQAPPVAARPTRRPTAPKASHRAKSQPATASREVDPATQVERRAVLVEQAKALRAAGLGWKTIATRWNEEGVPTLRGGRWDHSTIRDMVTRVEQLPQNGHVEAATPTPTRRHTAPTVTPSPELGAIVGTAPLTRGDLARRLWDYIKRHGLQDAQDRRQIHADAALKKVLGRDQVSMFEMNKLLKPHLQ